MIRRLIPLLLLGACAQTPTHIDEPPQLDGMIVYETGPCFGTCPVYAVTISQNLPIRFEGKRFTAVTGERTLDVRYPKFIELYEQVAKTLAPYRPDEAVAGTPERTVTYAPGQANCPNAPTDMPSVSVLWVSNRDGRADRLNFYYGCAAANPALAAALRTVPGLLPIGDLIGRR